MQRGGVAVITDSTAEVNRDGRSSKTWHHHIREAPHRRDAVEAVLRVDELDVRGQTTNGGSRALAVVDASRRRGGLEGWRGRSRQKRGRGRACCGGATKFHRGGIKRHRWNRRLCVHGGGSGISRSTRDGAECLMDE